MIHDRHFTREDAEAMLPALEPLLEELRTAKEELTDAVVHAVLADASAGNGGGAEGRQVGQAFLRARGLLAEIIGRGIVIRDIDRGLIDFPALVDGREVYLCWRLGEDGIRFFHDLDAGFQGRQRLE